MYGRSTALLPAMAVKELVGATAVRKWRKFVAQLMILIVSRQQWGSLGAWLKTFKRLKPKSDRNYRDEADVD